ncbi:MAG: tetratricopeptide repeat protein [Chitinispirillaceae bacterium]|nr:tetratricopeptide repeat protein [Chitinispirillaceae bacterium]
MKTSSISMRSTTILLIVLFIASLLFHGIVYQTILSKNDPFLKYPNFARDYVSNSFDNERLADFSPLYLAAHILAKKTVPAPKAFMVWLQIVLIAGSTVLFYLLLKSCFPFYCALAGAIVFTSCRSIMLYATVFEPEAFVVFFLLGFLVLVRKTSAYAAAGAGTFLALALCTRLNLFLLIILTPLFLYLDRNNRGLFRKRTTLFLAPILCALLALAARNKGATGEFTPVVMNPGYVFYEGNNPNANGQNAVYPPMIDNSAEEFDGQVDAAHEAYRHFARVITGEPMRISQVNRFWSAKAWNFIFDHPVRWTQHLAQKLFYSFNHARWHDIVPVFANDRSLSRSGILSVPFGFLAAMAIVGMALSIGAWRERLIEYSVVLSQLAVMVLTYASDRQRVALIALIVFFALVTATHILASEKPARNRIITAIAALCMAVPLFLTSERMRDAAYCRGRIEQAHKVFQQAHRERDQWDLEKASASNALAFALIPYLTESRMAGLRFQESYEKQALAAAKRLHANDSSTSSSLDLALMFMENGKQDSAEAILTRLATEKNTFSRTSALSSQPQFYLAVIRMHHGDTAAATDLLQRTLRKNPGDPWALSWLAVISGQIRYRDRIARYFSEIDAHYFMGLAFHKNNRFAEAAKSFSNVVEKVPRYQVGQMYLSLASGQSGDMQTAAGFFIRAMQEKGEPLFAEKEFIAIFRKWKSRTRNTEASYFLGMVLKAFGHYDEALEVFRTILQENPGMNAVIDQIQWLERARQSYDE